MTNTKNGAGFRLVACGRDGLPALALDALPASVLENSKAIAEFYGRVGFHPPWIGYLALDGEAVVGGGAFVGPPENGPGEEGRVEIAYFTAPEHQFRGYAGKTAAALVAIARAERPGIEIYAKTRPEPGPSPAILARLGFRRVGTAIDHEIGEAWAWLLA